MIKWPWVSRLAYDTVAAERDRLRDQNDKLIDHITRIDRASQGLTETPRQPKPQQEPMPAELREYIMSFPNKGYQSMMWKAAWDRRLKHHESWDEITKDVLKEDADNG